MKKYLKKENVFFILSIVIILIGTIVLNFSGFEKSMEFKAGTKIEVYIAKGFNKNDIMTIAKEVFDGEILFEEIEKLNQMACIRVENYSEEQNIRKI